jgi:hypothetical protein
VKKDSEPAESFVLIRSVVMDSGISLHRIIPSAPPAAAQSQQSRLISADHISVGYLQMTYLCADLLHMVKTVK